MITQPTSMFPVCAVCHTAHHPGGTCPEIHSQLRQIAMALQSPPQTYNEREYQESTKRLLERLCYAVEAVASRMGGPR